MQLTNSIEELRAEIARREGQKPETPEGQADYGLDLANLHLTLAVAHLRRQENEPAIEHLKKSLEYRPAPVTHAYLGAALLDEYQVAAAREHLDRAVELGPEEMLVYLKYGEFNYKLGFYPQAVENLEKAVRLQAPNEATARYLVALLEKARKHNRNVIVRAPVSWKGPGLGRLFSRLAGGRAKGRPETGFGAGLVKSEGE